MTQAIDLFGRLILAFLGIIAPIVLVLLSMFREGMMTLSSQYKNEKLQSESNIKEQIKKIGQAEKSDYAKIQQGLNELKKIRKKSQTKLSYLNPQRQIVKLFAPLFIAFLGVLLSILASGNIYIVLSAIAVSLICFVYALFVLWKLLGIIIEVRKIIDDSKKDYNTKTIIIQKR